MGASENINGQSNIAGCFLLEEVSEGDPKKLDELFSVSIFLDNFRYKQGSLWDRTVRPNWSIGKQVPKIS